MKYPEFDSTGMPMSREIFTARSRKRSRKRFRKTGNRNLGIWESRRLAYHHRRKLYLVELQLSIINPFVTLHPSIRRLCLNLLHSPFVVSLSTNPVHTPIPIPLFISILPHLLYICVSLISISSISNAHYIHSCCSVYYKLHTVIPLWLF